MDQGLWLHVVEVLDALGALQAPADGVATVIGNLGLELVQDFVEGPALGELHDEKHVRRLRRGPEELDDVGMVDPGQLPELDQKRFMVVFRLEHLDGDVDVPPVAVQHDAEAAFAEDFALLDLLVVDLLDELGRGCRKNGPTRQKGRWLLSLTHGLDFMSPADHGLKFDPSVTEK